MPTTRAAVAEDLLALTRHDPDVLTRTVLRTRSRHALEVLAQAAWTGRALPEILDHVLAGGADPALDVRWLGELAFVLAATPPFGLTTQGAALLEQVEALDRADELGERAYRSLVQLRSLRGDHVGALALVERELARQDSGTGRLTWFGIDALRSDAAQVDLAAARPEQVAAWMDAFNVAYVGSWQRHKELAPWRLDLDLDDELAPTLLDRLTTAPVAPVDAPDLVTVITACYRPGPSLLSAVRSVLAQSWGNLELLLVDDASGPEHETWLQRAVDLDPRVRLIRMPVNGGPYRARNAALRQARGVTATVVDADDVLHPRYLEQAMGALARDHRRVAVRGMGQRATDDLRVVRLGFERRASVASSLLFRLRPVLDRVGFFDTVRKGADTEYFRRLLAVFGSEAVHPLQLSIAVVRTAPTSLSAGDFGVGWRHRSRFSYVSAYTAWHATVGDGSPQPGLPAPAFRDPDVSAPRPFPAPRRWHRPGDPHPPSTAPFDLVVAGDWRRWGGPQNSMLAEIRAALDAGLRVGVMQLEALRFMEKQDRPLHPGLGPLVASGQVEHVLPDDDVDVDLLLVRYPPVLLHPPTLAGPPLRVRRLALVANQAPVMADGSDPRYVVADVDERARETFGVPVTWIPQGPAIRRLLLDEAPGLDITPWDAGGIVDVDAWPARDPDRPPGAGGRAVLGRVSRDHPSKFPRTAQELLTAYPQGPDLEVRMLGAERVVTGLLGEDLPEGWRVWPVDALDVGDFLRGLDFFVYHDAPGHTEAFGRVLLEAAATGLVVITDPRHRETFGDLLDYTEPGGAEALVRGYLADPERYRARIRAVRGGVAERFGPQSFVERIRTL